MPYYRMIHFFKYSKFPALTRNVNAATAKHAIMIAEKKNILLQKKLNREGNC